MGMRRESIEVYSSTENKFEDVLREAVGISRMIDSSAEFNYREKPYTINAATLNSESYYYHLLCFTPIDHG